MFELTVSDLYTSVVHSPGWRFHDNNNDSASNFGTYRIDLLYNNSLHGIHFLFNISQTGHNYTYIRARALINFVHCIHGIMNVVFVVVFFSVTNSKSQKAPGIRLTTCQKSIRSSYLFLITPNHEIADLIFLYKPHLLRPASSETEIISLKNLSKMA